jgi:tetratricopeptide (TPR) repeat protein/transcriptional regulator with XRE-family HTH domain
MPAEQTTGLGGLLRTLRERALLTQEDLAERSGVSVGTIAGLETGRTRRPRSGSVRLLAEALDLSEPERAAFVAAARGAPEPAGSAPGAGPVPAQLPSDLPDFTGRADGLKRLDELLPGDPGSRPSPVVLITGPPGVGKTTLAVHWAHRVADRFPDGQLYVNLRGFGTDAPADPAEVLRGFLDALGRPPARVPTDLDGRIGRYRSLLAGRRILVVLDNARDTDQVRPLLPGSPGCLVVVTSRHQLPGLIAREAAVPYTLDLMAVADARRLLARRLGRERVAAEPAAVDEIVTRCAGLPLGLAIVAARAATRPGFRLETVAVELATAGLDGFSGGEASTDLRGVFSWSYHRLSEPAARLFRLLGLGFGPDLAAPAAASMAGTESIRGPLAELARAHLLTEPAPGRYGMHDLLRAYAGELAEPDRPAAVRRLIEHYLHTGYAGARLLDPLRDPIGMPDPGPGVRPERFDSAEAAQAWFAAEHPVLLAAVDRAAAAGLDGYTWRLAWTMQTFLHRRGLWHDQAWVLRAALAAAERAEDPVGQALCHRYLGVSLGRTGRAEEAERHYRLALARYTELADRTGQARSHLDLGWAHNLRDRYLDGIRHYRRALELFIELDHRSGQALALNNIGHNLVILGDYRRALGYCERALALHRQGADRWGEATTVDSLGHAYHLLGEFTRAVDCYQQALVGYRAVGERYHEAETATRLGDVLEAAGDPDTAGRVWRDALAIFEELDDPDAAGVRTRLSAGRGDGRPPPTAPR